MTDSMSFILLALRITLKFAGKEGMSEVHILLRMFQENPLKTLTLRLLMSYIYGAPILDVSRSHTTTQHSR